MFEFCLANCTRIYLTIYIQVFFFFNYKYEDKFMIAYSNPTCFEPYSLEGTKGVQIGTCQRVNKPVVEEWSKCESSK